MNFWIWVLLAYLGFVCLVSLFVRHCERLDPIDRQPVRSTWYGRGRAHR